MSNYQKVKDWIFLRLQDISQKKEGLDEIDFDIAIEDVKKILSSSSDIRKVIFQDDEIKIKEEDLFRIKRELETLFDVKMEDGILIQGEEQQKRDTTWWTGEKKQICEKYYWGRYENYLKKSFPKKVLKTIDDDTDIAMNNIENPEIETFNRYGMVVGHVQSGKTVNYSSLVCKATDAGYKFIVVIAGGINNLRNQTQGRLNEAFVGRDKGVQVGVGLGNSESKKLPISLTTTESDFNKTDANRNSQGLNFDNIRTPVLLVIKKNTNTLTNVITWLEKQYKNGISDHAMLMIDDESDYASINTKDEDNPTTINRKLRKLLSLFKRSCYVAYTATPYANIFIDHEAGHENIGRDLFPKDFIYALDAPSNYFGARKIFLDSNEKNLVCIDDYWEDIPPNHKKDFELPSIPKSLKNALCIFLLNIVIRNLRGQIDQHNSMLIHATRFTAVHQRLALHVINFIEEIRKELKSYGKLPNASAQSDLIKKLEEKYLERDDVLDKPDWNKVLKRFYEIIDTVVIREVHQSAKIPLEYRKGRVTNAIVIGGTSLSRGFTLEGLSVSYFLRNTIFYDTLMQMGRWFGYRVGYEDLCKIYLSESMKDNFGNIIEATEDLIKDFKLMSDNKKTPNDFGLAVRQHPNSALQVTARNKQKNVQEFIFNMRLDGQSKETSWLSNKEEDINTNIVTIEMMIKKLNHIYQKESIGNNHLWRNVDKKVVADFLNRFCLYQTDPLGITARMPIAFVKKYVEERDTDWDIALYSGIGVEENIDNVKFRRVQRKSNVKDGHIEIANRQISSGSSESISLKADERKELGSNRKEIRKYLKKPLLMLHILQTESQERLSAFGVSFPGSVLSSEETISLKINTVYYKNLLEEESDD